MDCPWPRLRDQPSSGLPGANHSMSTALSADLSTRQTPAMADPISPYKITMKFILSTPTFKKSKLSLREMWAFAQGTQLAVGRVTTVLRGEWLLT